MLNLLTVAGTIVSIAVGVVAAGLVVFAIGYKVWCKKHGKSGCGCNCSSCGCCSCHTKEKKEEKKQ